MKVWHQYLREVGYFLVGGVVGLSLLIGLGYYSYRDRVMPGVSVAGVSVEGLTREELSLHIQNVVAAYQLDVIVGETRWSVPLEAVDYDVEKTVNKAYGIGRDLREYREFWNVLVGGADIDIFVEVSAEKIDELVKEMSPYIESDYVAPSLIIEDERAVLVEGKTGIVIDKSILKKNILARLSRSEYGEIAVPVIEESSNISPAAQAVILSRGDQLVGDTLELTFENEKYFLVDDGLIGFLKVTGDEVIARDLVTEYVESLKTIVEREPVNAKFSYVDGRVEEFEPDLSGINLDVEKTAFEIEAAMAALLGESKFESVELVVNEWQAEITTEQVNDLGIVEKLGQGVSYYAGSIASRVHNVGLAAQRLNGTLVAPGEEFSYNKALGEVSSATGYMTAYVISGGRTVLGDGGGVCQDSTTVFRAAMDAGLPIVERWPHSYRVGYYEQNAKPGLDATVYAPSKDLRFLNDTGAYILVQAKADSINKKLIVDLYGKSDGRTSYVSEVRVWDVTPPPPDLYQDDPTLPVGTVKQVDWAAWGAKSSFDYKVTRYGEEIFAKTYYSAYRPWQNVYLRGTKTE